MNEACGMPWGHRHPQPLTPALPPALPLALPYRHRHRHRHRCCYYFIKSALIAMPTALHLFAPRFV